MIVTLTANPSLDRTVMLPAALQVGDVQSAASAREDAGGKGINVARAITAAGEECTAVLPLAIGDPFAAALREAALHTHRVAVAGHVRANLAITDPAGVTTKLNLPGAELSADEVGAVIDAVVAASAGARWLVLAGSLPPGAGDDFYVRAMRAVRTAHGDAAPLIAVDTSGPALTAVVADGRPDLIKPNDDELSELAGTTIEHADAGAIADIARSIVPARAGAALVTLGARGALLVEGGGAWAASPPPIQVVSTVGAGDSSLAGYVLAATRGAGPDERLRLAVRYGAAAASLPGTQAPAPADLPTGDVPVTRLA
ncbi:1-phosphofructokinase family hexose kinase [Microbacterium sp. M3]|uniref:1-phosphofructokinase family hexose kinase n=1 Tax=Microbacterium arthrosphaerae TaxID=792652 RepID=A0ABU4H0R0_9MICO|nr:MULTISPECIES: 1-phosphofructokinase family hexose kinase [Microbacterium]MDW4572893.1 1-phosphofructokinase family hexose kinase [Microbacterium arthrosphaerae]MDW7606748.1 1-phosphofructokinase family hexose kinase [Microbacterium sp. M3]